MMTASATWIPKQATVYLQQLEILLGDLGFWLGSISRAMLALSKEYRRDFRKTALILDPKIRPGEELPTALYWATFRQRRHRDGESRLPGFGIPKCRKIHLSRKRLDHDFLFLVAREAGRKSSIFEYDRRRQLLNGAYRQVRKAIMSIESTLISRGERRCWESGDHSIDAPLISTDLRPRSRQALGAAWFYLLRLASLEQEMAALAERYNGEPVWDGLRLSFGRDAAHPYGRVYWVHAGGRLPRLDRSKGAREILTDKIMRRLRIAESDRRALSRHEQHRRRMTRLHKRYTVLLGQLKRRGRSALAAADANLLASRPGMSSAI
jgi:hypothetical protein